MPEWDDTTAYPNVSSVQAADIFHLSRGGVQMTALGSLLSNMEYAWIMGGVNANALPGAAAISGAITKLTLVTGSASASNGTSATPDTGNDQILIDSGTYLAWFSHNFIANNTATNDDVGIAHYLYLDGTVIPGINNTMRVADSPSFAGGVYEAIPTATGFGVFTASGTDLALDFRAQILDVVAAAAADATTTLSFNIQFGVVKLKL